MLARRFSGPLLWKYVLFSIHLQMNDRADNGLEYAEGITSHAQKSIQYEEPKTFFYHKSVE